VLLALAVETANVVVGNIAVLKTKKHYCLYSDDAFYESLLKFFMQDKFYAG